MAVMDEFREEREAIKHAPLKKKILYFWDYYKLHTIIIIVVTACVIGIVYTVNTNKDIVLNGILLNCYSSEGEYMTDDIADNFLEEQGIDTTKYDVEFITDLTYEMERDEVLMAKDDTTKQAIAVHSGAGTLDFITGSFDDLMDLAYKGYFIDLTEVLSEEEYNMYEPYFLYLDMDIYNQRKEIFDKGEDASSIQIPDCTKKEMMEEPVPVLIDMSQSESLLKAYNKSTETLAFGIVGNAPNLENTLDFVDYLMNN